LVELLVQSLQRNDVALHTYVNEQSVLARSVGITLFVLLPQRGTGAFASVAY